VHRGPLGARLRRAERGQREREHPGAGHGCHGRPSA
jgi:hypothetical protein